MGLEFYDIMAEDMIIYARCTKGNQVHVLVTDEYDKKVFSEISSKDAWDTLVYFAKQIVSENENMEREDE